MGYYLKAIWMKKDIIKDKSEEIDIISDYNSIANAYLENEEYQSAE